MHIPGLTALRPFSSILAGALLIAAASAAAAQGTEEERRACTPDVMRLCREFIPSVSAITQCLIDKRAELNPDCRQVMAPTKPEPIRQASAKRRSHQAQRGVTTPKHPRKPAPQTASADPRTPRPPMDITPGPRPPAASVARPKKGPGIKPARSAAAAKSKTTP